jgi:hypothetical protein
MFNLISEPDLSLNSGGFNLPGSALPITTLMFLLLSFSTAGGTTFFVPQDYLTIQGGIDACSDGDILIVNPGSYVGEINFKGKRIAVRSESGPLVTSIVGRGSGSVVSFLSGEQQGSSLEGFTIRNGAGNLINSAFHGGGICCYQASPTLVGNVIRNNYAEYGGGISCLDFSTAVISGNTFKENMAGFGGGLNIEHHSNPSIVGNTIFENSAEIDGGGIRCFYGSSPPISGNEIFLNNAFAGRGGGINCGDASPHITHNAIYQNISERCGGGIYGTLSNPRIENNRITENTSKNGYGGGCNFADFSNPVILCNVIHDNLADGGGGGVNCIDYSLATVVNNIVSNNKAAICGGGLCCLNSSEMISLNNTVTGNWAGDAGGGLCCNVESKTTVCNNIIWDNQAKSGNEIYIGRPSDPSEVSLEYSDVKGGLAEIRIRPGCVLKVGSGIIDADPIFFDPLTNDFHLCVDSPCRNMGNILNTGLLALDFEGDPRHRQKKTDIGADEFHFHLYSVGKIVSGSPVPLHVTGLPGMSVILGIADGVNDAPFSTPYGNLYLEFPLTNSSFLGFIPAQGILKLPMQIPTQWQAGSNHYLQALVGALGGTYSALTNTIVLTAE